MSGEGRKCESSDLRLDQTAVVESLKAGSTYKFLGVCETVLQDEKRTIKLKAKCYLKGCR